SSVVIHQGGKLMTRSKVPSDADLQVALLKRIAAYRCKRIPVATLLSPAKDVLGSDDQDPALSLLTSDRVRESEWEQRSINALKEMYENEAWIDLEYLGDAHCGSTLAIDSVITLANQHRFVVTMTRRGQIFLKRGRNPKSRHGRAP